MSIEEGLATAPINLKFSVFEPNFDSSMIKMCYLLVN